MEIFTIYELKHFYHCLIINNELKIFPDHDGQINLVLEQLGTSP